MLILLALVAELGIASAFPEDPQQCLDRAHAPRKRIKLNFNRVHLTEASWGRLIRSCPREHYAGLGAIRRYGIRL